MKHISKAMKVKVPSLSIPGHLKATLIILVLVSGTIHGAQVTVGVDSTRNWIGWLNIFSTNNTYLGGYGFDTYALPSTLVPAATETGWPLHSLLILQPNTSTYNTNDGYWNYPDGRPNKILEPHYYVDVFTDYSGKTVVFQGSVTSNSIPGLSGDPAAGWQTFAWIKEFTPSYGYIGWTAVPLSANNSFSVSRAIGVGNVCQYGFFVRGPNAAPGSVNARTGIGILVQDSDPLITAGPYGYQLNEGDTLHLYVIAVGGSALNYQWRRDGLPLTNGGRVSGADTANLMILSALEADSGQYSVVVSNTSGVLTSQSAQMMVIKQPCVIANEATPFAVRTLVENAGGGLTLSWDSCNEHLYEVQASDGSPGQTLWIPYGLMIGGDGSTVWSDATTPAPQSRFYRVQRFSFAGDEDGDGLSNLGEFTRQTDLRNVDTDGDQLPDGWEVRYDLDPLSQWDAYADVDADGYSGFQEYQLNSKPNHSYSQPAYFPRDLVAWWKCDEGAGTNVVDSSLGGNHGVVAGGDPAGVWISGHRSNAVMLGGAAGNWIQAPFPPGLSAAAQWTLMGWVRPSAQGDLVGNWDPSGQSYGNFRLRFGPELIELWFSPTGDGLYETLQFNPAWSTNQWHHLAAGLSAESLNLFVDGELRTNLAVADQFVAVPNPILIGFPGVGDAYSVDDVRIYNQTLTTNEIASLSRGNGLPPAMIVGQTASLRVFGVAENSSCAWSLLAGPGFLTNIQDVVAEFRPSWLGSATVQVISSSSGVLSTNVSSTVASFPSLSPISDWNQSSVQPYNNCYNYATDIRTDTFAQPGQLGPYSYTCAGITGGAVTDGLQSGVNLADLCGTSGLPKGHIIALLVWPPLVDFHFARMEEDGTWSHKPGPLQATKLDNGGQPISDPRTANFGNYQFCGFFWVGPNVRIR